ncbi:MAG: GNAT family N-acetyltransferase [Paracoccaceae bacterium]
MTFTYRPSKGSDAIACATFIREWAAETPWMVPVDDLEPMAQSWVGMLESETAWVAEREGRVVGFCVREEDNITGLYISPDAQSCGIGKALLDLAKTDRDWITVWVYEKNERARAFYRREGLVQIGREKDEYSHLMYIEKRWTRS